MNHWQVAPIICCRDELITWLPILPGNLGPAGRLSHLLPRSLHRQLQPRRGENNLTIHNGRTSEAYIPYVHTGHIVLLS